jgi:hypothetical protein
MAARNVATTSKRPAWARDLSDKEYAWLLSYLQTFNRRQAAIDAGHSEVGAHSRGSEIAKKPHIRKAIEGALKERLPAIKLTLAERLAAIATTDITQITSWGKKKIQINQGAVDADGKAQKPRYQTVWDLDVKPSSELSPSERASIKTIKKRPTLYGTGIELTMHDPISAAEKLATLLELVASRDGDGGGNVTFVIELPDGSTITDMGKAPTIIDNDAIRSHVRARKTAAEDEVPPGTRLVIEPP